MWGLTGVKIWFDLSGIIGNDSVRSTPIGMWRMRMRVAGAWSILFGTFPICTITTSLPRWKADQISPIKMNFALRFTSGQPMNLGMIFGDFHCGGDSTFTYEYVPSLLHLVSSLRHYYTISIWKDTNTPTYQSFQTYLSLLFPKYSNFFTKSSDYYVRGAFGSGRAGQTCWERLS